VIGQETYGKGTVQNLYPLDRDALGQDPGYGQLTVTIGMYYRVTGDTTQNRGVQPDVSLPSAIDTEEVGESSRDAALPWNRIRPAQYRPEGTQGQVIVDLQRLHEQRIATDPDFQHLVAEVATVEKMRDLKSVSLNLEKRREERKTLTHGELMRENDRRAAVGEEALDDVEKIEDRPDVILGEAAQITADLVVVEPRHLARAKAAN
jgi:carboxyl-terminal processing protease